jgi:hypothetical protein
MQGSFGCVSKLSRGFLPISLRGGCFISNAVFFNSILSKVIQRLIYA